MASLFQIIGKHKCEIFILALIPLVAFVWYLTKQPIFPVILCALPLGALFVLRNPFFMVLMFIIFSFFRIHEVFPFLSPLKLPLLLALGSLVSIGWAVFLQKSVKPFMTIELKT